MSTGSSEKLRRPLLLDVNLLLALAWPNHQFHAEAQGAVGRSRHAGPALPFDTRLAVLARSREHVEVLGNCPP